MATSRNLTPHSGRLYGRALLRIAGPLVVVYILITLTTVTFRAQDLIGWVLYLSGSAFAVAFALFLGARVYFGSLLRRHDPERAAALGLGSKWELDGARTLQRNEALSEFLKRREHQRFETSRLRHAGTMYLAAQRFAQLTATLMIGSILALITTAYVLH
jgi:hypothetical protein